MTDLGVPTEVATETQPPSKRASTRSQVTGAAGRALKYLANNRPALLAVLIVALIAYMTYYHQYSFPTASNAKAVLLNASVMGILVVGMMLLMIAGAFDLSIGSILALSGISSALFVTQFGLPPWLAILGGIAVGALCGLANALIITKLRINALIATLAMAGILRGCSELFGGSNIPFISDEFARFGQADFLGLQAPFWVFAAVVTVAAILVGKTRFFRQYYFVGSNERAATLSGMQTQRLILIAFVIMGVLAGLAGVLSAARLNTATTSAGMGVELHAITAAVLGGAALKGGQGTILGGVLGVLFIALIDNALIILNVEVLWQDIVVGIVLLAALSFDRWKGSGGG